MDTYIETFNVENCKKLPPKSLQVLIELFRLVKNQQLPDQKKDIDEKLGSTLGSMSDSAIRKQFQVICDELEIPDNINGARVNRRDLLHDILRQNLKLQKFLEKADLTRSPRKSGTRRPGKNQEEEHITRTRSNGLRKSGQECVANEQPKLSSQSNRSSRVSSHNSGRELTPSPPMFNFRDLENSLNYIHQKQEIILENQEIVLENQEISLQEDLEYTQTFLKTWWELNPGNQKVIDYLNHLIDIGDEFVRIEVASTLCQIDQGNKDAFNILLEATKINGNDERISRLACKKLGEVSEVGLRKPKAIEVLIDLFDTSHQQRTKIAIMKALGKIGRGDPKVLHFFDDLYKTFSEQEDFENNLSQEEDWEACNLEENKEQEELIDLSEEKSRFTDQIKDYGFNISMERLEKLDDEEQDGDIEIKVELLPDDPKSQLPPNLRLIIFNQSKDKPLDEPPEDGEIVMTVYLEKGGYSIEVVMEEKPIPIYKKYFLI